MNALESIRNWRQHDEAIADYTEAARLRIDDPWIYITRGGVYHENGMYQEAISDYTHALKMKAASLWAHYARGLSYLKLGQYDQAIADFNSLTIDPNANPTSRIRGVEDCK